MVKELSLPSVRCAPPLKVTGTCTAPAIFSLEVQKLHKACLAVITSICQEVSCKYSTNVSLESLQDD